MDEAGFQLHGQALGVARSGLVDALAWLRGALTNSECVYADVSSRSFAYLSIGGDVGTTWASIFDDQPTLPGELPLAAGGLIPDPSRTVSDASLGADESLA